MKITLYVLVVIFSSFYMSPIYSADPNYGRNLTASCANCHGTDGKSINGMHALSGLNKLYLLNQMKDFKSGKRPSTVMYQIAKGYTDEQIQAIAEYLSDQKTLSE